MSPKIALWIGFTLVSSTWYALDPEAHGTGYQAVAQHGAATQIEHLVADQAPEQALKTAMN